MKAIRKWDDNCEINIFPPGFYMAKNRELVPYYQPVWEDKRILELDYHVSEEEVCNQCKKSLTKAVEKRLMADVPFGVLLSGGLDSSLTTSITDKILKREREIKGLKINYIHSQLD